MCSDLSKNIKRVTETTLQSILNVCSNRNYLACSDLEVKYSFTGVLSERQVLPGLDSSQLWDS